MNVLEHFLNKLNSKNYQLHCCLIKYRGKLIYEGCALPFTLEDEMMVYSIAKSFVSIAIGYLIEEGKLSLNDTIDQFFEDFKDVDILKQITIENLLTMQSGSNHEQMIMFSDDWVNQYFNQKFYYLPGTHFHYNSMNSYILSVIVTHITDLKLVDYLDIHLFKPLGIKKPRFDEDDNGYNIGGWGLYLKPKDLMDICDAFMHNHPTFPLVYKHLMTVKQVSSDTKYNSFYYKQGYGFHCWMNGENLGYRFDGVFGQFAIMVPTLDLVIVTNASQLKSSELLETIFNDFIKLLPQDLKITNIKLPDLIKEYISDEFDFSEINNYYYEFKNKSCSILPLAITFLKHQWVGQTKKFKFSFLIIIYYWTGMNKNL